MTGGKDADVPSDHSPATPGGPAAPDDPIGLRFVMEVLVARLSRLRS